MSEVYIVLAICVVAFCVTLIVRRWLRTRAAHRRLRVARIDSLGGLEFEAWVTELLRAHPRYLGVHDLRGSGDSGIDITAYRRGRVIPEKLAIQVKRYSKPVGRPVVMETYAVAHYYGWKPVIITQSGFTPSARKWAKRLGVELIGRKGLENLMVEAGL